MDDLVHWLGAQLDEDERIARAATEGPWSVDSESYAESINAADGTFSARLLVPASGLGGTRLDGGFTGRWLSSGNLILTAIAVPA